MEESNGSLMLHCEEESRFIVSILVSFVWALLICCCSSVAKACLTLCEFDQMFVILQLREESSVFQSQSLSSALVRPQVLPFPSQVVYNRVGKCGSRTVVLLLRILSEKHGFNLVTSDIHNKTRLTKNEQVSCLCFFCTISRCLPEHPSTPTKWIPELQYHTVFLPRCGRKFKLRVLTEVCKPGSFPEGIILLRPMKDRVHGHCLFS